MASRANDLRKLLVEWLPEYVVLVPFLVALAAYVVGVCLAPDIDTDIQHARWTSFFGTAAQVTAALFIVLILERRVAARTQTFQSLGGAIVTVSYVAVGLLASGAGLSPSLSDDMYRQVFALTFAAGVGALLSVVLIAIRALTLEYVERDDEIRDQVEDLYAALAAVKRPPPE